MIKKIILGATLSLFAIGVSANTLNIKNKTSSPLLFVNCNGSATIPVIPSISYSTIATMFPKNPDPTGYPNQYQCNFQALTGPIGSATIKLMPGFQTAQIISDSTITGYQVTIAPQSALIQPVPDISVTLN